VVVLAAAGAAALVIANRGTGTTVPIASLTDGSSIKGGVTSVAWSPDGTTLAAGDFDGIIYLWDTASGHRLSQLNAGGSISSVVFSPNGSELAVGDNDGAVNVYNVDTRQLIEAQKCPLSLTGGVSSVVFSPDGDFLAAGDGNGATYLFDLVTHGSVATVSSPSSALVSSVAFNPDGTVIAVGDNNGDTYLYNTSSIYNTTKPQDLNIPLITIYSQPEVVAGVSAVAFSPNGKILAAADRAETISLWDVETGQRIATLAEPSGKIVNSVAFSPNGVLLASGDGNGKIYLWNVATGSEVSTMKDPGSGTGGVTAVAFSKDGGTLASGDGDDTTYLWKVTGG
jgi:WD40 repeat protein